MSETAGRVLVIDDDPAARVSLEGVLAGEFDVSSVPDVAAAEPLLCPDTLDVVLTDYDMPGRTGLDLIKIARERCPDAMIILVTGHTEIAELKQVEDGETVVRVIHKPYEPRRLLQWVANAVKLSRMRRTMHQLAKARKPPPKGP